MAGVKLSSGKRESSGVSPQRRADSRPCVVVLAGSVKSQLCGKIEKMGGRPKLKNTIFCDKIEIRPFGGKSPCKIC